LALSLASVITSPAVVTTSKKGSKVEIAGFGCVGILASNAKGTEHRPRAALSNHREGVLAFGHSQPASAWNWMQCLCSDTWQEGFVLVVEMQMQFVHQEK
jgi:hypothetical protein